MAAPESTSYFLELAQNLGFHDTTSLFLVAIFALCAVAFVWAGAVFLKKKKQERLSQINEVVKKVQEEISSAKAEQAQPIKEPKARKLEVKNLEKEAQPNEKTVEKTVPEHKIEEIKVEAKKQVPSVEPKKIQPEAKKDDLPQVKKPEQSPKIKSEPMAKKVEEKPKAQTKSEPKEVIIEEEPKPQELKQEIKKVEVQKNLGAALKDTRGGFMKKLARLFSLSHEINDEDFEEMETILFTADIGVKTAQKLLDGLKEQVAKNKNSSRAFLKTALKQEMEKIFAQVEGQKMSNGVKTPKVMMFVGVNGAGKTTSIGKLGAQFTQQGKKVLFGAGDTFRAAAVKQLGVWGERVGAQVVSGKENADSASVLFECIEEAKKKQADVVLCDTAGRLHTKGDLMEELKKVHKVVNKAHEGAPHEVFLVVDATMGQNAIMQAREFSQITPLTGIIVSKLDGTAKGGVALGIVDELKIPIRYIGIGEQVNDLREFDAKQFIDALFQEGE